MKPYPAYKPSGVPWLGDVPDSWSALRVKEVATVLPSNIDKLTVNGELPVLLCNYVDVYKNDKIAADIEFMPATASDEQIRKLSLAKGDVVLTKDSESPWDIAVPTYIAEDIPNLVCGYHLAKLAPNVSLMRGDFLCWALKSFPVSVHFSLAASGITRYGLSIANISDGNIPVPLLAEQQAIATFLDRETARIDTLIAEKVHLIDTLREYRQATISEVVTQGLNPAAPKKPSGVPWLGDVPAHWKVRRLKSLLNEPLIYGANEAADGDEPGNPRFIRITDMNDNGCLREETFRSLPLDLAKPYLLIDGDVLLARSGATVGKSFLYDGSWGSCCFAGYLIRARFNQDVFMPKFFYACCQSTFYWQYVSGTQIQSTIQNLNAEKYANLWLPCPPMEEQQAIAAYLDHETARIDKLVDHVQDEIKLLQELRAATITDAVTGKIQVP